MRLAAPSPSPAGSSRYPRRQAYSTSARQLSGLPGGKASSRWWEPRSCRPCATSARLRRRSRRWRPTGYNIRLINISLAGAGPRRPSPTPAPAASTAIGPDAKKQTKGPIGFVPSPLPAAMSEIRQGYAIIEAARLPALVDRPGGSGSWCSGRWILSDQPQLGGIPGDASVAPPSHRSPPRFWPFGPLALPPRLGLHGAARRMFMSSRIPTLSGPAGAAVHGPVFRRRRSPPTLPARPDRHRARWQHPRFAPCHPAELWPKVCRPRPHPPPVSGHLRGRRAGLAPAPQLGLVVFVLRIQAIREFPTVPGAINSRGGTLAGGVRRHLRSFLGAVIGHANRPAAAFHGRHPRSNRARLTSFSGANAQRIEPNQRLYAKSPRGLRAVLTNANGAFNIEDSRLRLPDRAHLATWGEVVKRHTAPTISRTNTIVTPGAATSTIRSRYKPLSRVTPKGIQRPSSRA